MYSQLAEAFVLTIIFFIITVPLYIWLKDTVIPRLKGNDTRVIRKHKQILSDYMVIASVIQLFLEELVVILEQNDYMEIDSKYDEFESATHELINYTMEHKYDLHSFFSYSIDLSSIINKENGAIKQRSNDVESIKMILHDYSMLLETVTILYEIETA